MIVSKKILLVVCRDSSNQNGLLFTCFQRKGKKDFHTQGHPSLQHNIQPMRSECLASGPTVWPTAVSQAQLLCTLISGVLGLELPCLFV